MAGLNAVRRLAIVALVSLSAAAGAQPADEAFDRVLHRHVKDGTVNYPAVVADADFRAYVASLAGPVQGASRDERLARYMNAYNALAMEGILEGLSPDSRLGRLRFFRLKEWPFDARRIHLYGLEHDVLIPMGEPRIHFSIVCASRSCPKLRSEVYAAQKLQAQMDENARAFINDPARNRFDPASRVAHLSPIFNWYESDFVGAAGSVQKYIARYVADPDVARGLSQDRYAIEWNDYDWSLNGIPPVR